MRTILHIGMPKTGTTAIQSGLAHARDHLKAAGILFPENPPGCEFRNHNLLAAGFAKYDRLPRQFRNKANYTPDTLREKYREFVAHVRDQAVAQQPECMVLSSEVLFRRISPADYATIARDIGGFSRAIRVIAYLRAPADHYASGVQQILKASHIIKTMEPPRYASILRSYSTAFGPGEIVARAFDRGQLVNGDVIDDLVAVAFADFDIDLAIVKRGVQPNETLSAEAMFLLRDFRETFHRHENNIYSKPTSELIRLLLRTDRATGTARPRLKPEYVDVLNHCRPDPLTLRDEYGVEFSGVDYSRLERGAFRATIERTPTLRELFFIDDEKLGRVAEVVARSTWARGSPERRRWIANMLVDAA